MDSYPMNETAVLVAVGCQDGLVQLSLKRKRGVVDEDASWRTERIFQHRIHGPVSGLRLFATPTLFGHHSVHYEIEDESESMSMWIGSCSGYAKVYFDVATHGFVEKESEYLSAHQVSSADICDAVLCGTTLSIKGSTFVLFGTYSGRLLCYRYQDVDNNFMLAFEAQFDQQIHGIMVVQDNLSIGDISRGIIVHTMNRIHFLNVHMMRNTAQVDRERIISV